MKYTLADSLTIRKVGEEVFVLDRNQSVLHSFNKTGIRLWEGLSQGASVEQLVERILEEFEVSREQATGDASKFVEVCRDRGLISVVDPS